MSGLERVRQEDLAGDRLHRAVALGAAPDPDAIAAEGRAVEHAPRVGSPARPPLPRAPAAARSTSGPFRIGY